MSVRTNQFVLTDTECHGGACHVSDQGSDFVRRIWPGKTRSRGAHRGQGPRVRAQPGESADELTDARPVHSRARFSHVADIAPFLPRHVTSQCHGRPAARTLSDRGRPGLGRDHVSRAQPATHILDETVHRQSPAVARHPPAQAPVQKAVPSAYHRHVHIRQSARDCCCPAPEPPGALSAANQQHQERRPAVPEPTAPRSPLGQAWRGIKERRAYRDADICGSHKLIRLRPGPRRMRPREIGNHRDRRGARRSHIPRPDSSLT